VVNLSSVGAELAEGTGPIAGLHAYLAALHPVVAAGVLPGLEAADATIPLLATRDGAAVAVRELTQPTHSGVLILHAPSLLRRARWRPCWVTPSASHNCPMCRRPLKK
jgi:hypothetical protein